MEKEEVKKGHLKKINYCEYVMVKAKSVQTKAKITGVSKTK